MACLWSEKPPAFEDFFPDEDADTVSTSPSDAAADDMALKISSTMRKLGGKTAAAEPAVRTYSQADLEFLERVNSKLLGRSVKLTD